VKSKINRTGADVDELEGQDDLEGNNGMSHSDEVVKTVALYIAYTTNYTHQTHHFGVFPP